MPNFKYEFEHRRVIFGLTAIVNTPPQNMPALVNDRLPEIVKQMAMLSLKMRDIRVEVLRDNEDHLKE